MPFNSNIPKDFTMEVGKGLVAGHVGDFSFGNNPSLGTSQENIWQYGGLITLPTVASTFYLSSDEVGDTTQVYLVTVLSADYSKRVETVTLTGQTPVAIPNGTCIAINKATNISADATTGDVYIASEDNHLLGVPLDGTKVLGSILAGDENLMHGMYTVPLGQTIFTITSRAWVGKGQDATISIYAKPSGLVPVKLAVFQVFENNFENTFPVPGGIPEKATIEFRGTTSAGTIECSIDFGFICIDNDFL